ncbi:hypothetical protein [Effusibacillus pohliae]|uniref:hypothetical protein n=1 Tax=Effusibacillus pohliae TaxID=232270 RepID=UPI0012EA92A9|nr:hypothetical protein [Effusibacillus pohliae]
MPLLLLALNFALLVCFALAHPGFDVRITRLAEQQNGVYLYIGRIEIENLQRRTNTYRLWLIDLPPGSNVHLQQQLSVPGETIRQVPLVIFQPSKPPSAPILNIQNLQGRRARKPVNR